MIVDVIPPDGPLAGEVRPPGDKSISHRALLFAAMAEGTSEVSGVLDSADVRSTAGVIASLGAEVDLQPAASGSLEGTVTGWGVDGPRTPEGYLDCGNSGTTARLVMGVLAGWPIQATLVGDESLSRRPMGRVTSPLSEMGARFETETGTLPVTVHGATLRPAEYSSPVASAQVKSAILLAGLRATGRSTVTEPAPSRDHTERMLPAFGVRVAVDRNSHQSSVSGPATLSATRLSVPADPSSAAFLVGAALVIPDSNIVIRDVSLNPTRCGFLRVLERMGADIQITTHIGDAVEETGDLKVRYTGELLATEVVADEIPSLIDEVPLLALIASRASGETRFEGVGELRVKESDRLGAIIDGLRELGAQARAEGDTLIVTGVPSWNAAELDSLGDHRLAMTWAVAGLGTKGGVNVGTFEAVEVSYPQFLGDIDSLLA